MFTKCFFDEVFFVYLKIQQQPLNNSLFQVYVTFIIMHIDLFDTTIYFDCQLLCTYYNCRYIYMGYIG